MEFLTEIEFNVLNLYPNLIVNYLKSSDFSKIVEEKRS